MFRLRWKLLGYRLVILGVMLVIIVALLFFLLLLFDIYIYITKLVLKIHLNHFLPPTKSQHSLINPTIQSLTNPQSPNISPISLPNNKIQNQIFSSPTIPLLTIFTFRSMILFFILCLIKTIIYSICIYYAGLGTGCEDWDQATEFLAAVELYGLFLGLDLGEGVD